MLVLFVMEIIHEVHKHSKELVETKAEQNQSTTTSRRRNQSCTAVRCAKKRHQIGLYATLPGYSVCYPGTRENH